MTQPITKLRRQPGTDAEIRLRNLVNKIALSVDKLSAIGREGRIFAQDIRAGHLDKAVVRDRLREAAQVYALDIEHAEMVDLVIDAALNGEATPKAPVSNAAPKARSVIEPPAPAPEPRPVGAKAPEQTPDGKADRSKKQFTLYRDLEASSTKLWLVKNLLGHAEASAFYGAPGSGKSALIEDMGLHIAAGLPWHGREVKQGLVVYTGLERRLLVERRAIGFRIHHNIPDLPFAIIGGVYDFRDRRTAAAIASIVQEIEAALGQQAVLIIIDTISRALNGGDENSSKDMGAIVATTARLQETAGAHVSWVHHVPIDAGERLRGHGALLGALDTTINVEKLANGIRTATVIKANDSEEGERVTFKLESVTIGPETTAPVVVQAEDQPRVTSGEPRLTPNLRTMFSLLHAAGQTGLTTEEWYEKARTEGLGVKRPPDLYDFRESLKAKKLVRHYGDRWNVCL